MTASFSTLSPLKDEMISWRHYFHQHPELGFEEIVTSQKIAELLEEFGIEVHKDFGKTGLVGVLKNGESTKSLAIRAEFDALPIQENNDLPFASQNPGVMHACGHDGHTTMLLGAAKYLSETKNFNGTVYFIFQPAEEISTGAKAMLDDGLLEKFQFSSIFGLHNAPGIDAGKISVRSGATLASKDDFEVVIHGKSGHAAFPPESQAILISSQVIDAVKNLLKDKVHPTEQAVLSLTQVHGGNSFNIIPESVTIAGTLRCLSENDRQKSLAELDKTVQQICDENHCTYELKFHQTCPVVLNTPDESDFATQVAIEVFGKDNVITNDHAVMATDDFAHFLEKVPGVYLSLGNGPENGNVHTPGYKFNDEILISGATLWSKLVEEYLG